jgi:hypothetical protein
MGDQFERLDDIINAIDENPRGAFGGGFNDTMGMHTEEPSDFSMASDPVRHHISEPASYTFKDLQSLGQGLGAGAGAGGMASIGSMGGMSGGLQTLQFDAPGDREANMGLGGYGELPSGSPMFKFGASPMKVKSEFDQWQLPHTGLTPTAGASGAAGLQRGPVGAPAGMSGVPPSVGGGRMPVPQGNPALGAASAGNIQHMPMMQNPTATMPILSTANPGAMLPPAAVINTGAARPAAAMQQGSAAALPKQGSQKRSRARSSAAVDDDDDDDDDGYVFPVSDKRKFTNAEAVAVLNRKGGPVSEEDLARIDPGTLSTEDVKKLKKLRRAIRNRESATASRLRRKEYIENLEKRMSELSSQNTLLNISVTEMQMREKEKRDEEERIRQENEQLRADTESTRTENMRLREEKMYMQQVQDKFAQFKLMTTEPSGHAMGVAPDEIVEPPTWPPPTHKPQVVVLKKRL